MLTRNTIAKSTIVILSSVIGVLLLSLVLSGSASAIAVEADPHAAPQMHQVTQSNMYAPQAAGSLTDTTVANFQAGSGGCYAAPSAGGDLDGELILLPTIGITFTGAALPTGWYSGTYTDTGTVNVGGGLLTAAGAYAGDSTVYPPTRTLEFSATFAAAAKEHIGLTTSPELNAGPWAIFSTGATGDQLYARTTDNSTSTDTPLGTSYLGTGHRYRIVWTTTMITYSVDEGATIVTHTSPQITEPNQMRPIVSSVFADNNLIVDWLRMSPYATSCAFQSRVLDAGQVVSWQN